MNQRVYLKTSTLFLSALIALAIASLVQAIETPSSSSDSENSQIPSSNLSGAAVENESAVDGAEVISEDINSTPSNTKQSKTMRRIDRGRNALADGYTNVASALDRFLSNNRIAPETNKSFLKGEVQTTRFDNGKTEFDFRIKAKADLSRTEQRWRVFFDSDVNEDDSVESQIRSTASGDRVEPESTVAGVEFRDEKRYYIPDVSLGARFNSGLDPYLKLRMGRIQHVRRNWDFRAKQDLWYLGNVGWGATSYFDVFRPLTDAISFLTYSQLEYRFEEERWQFGHRWILQKIYSDDYQVSMRIGHLADENSKAVFHRHFINVNFRKRLNEEWLFGNFTPEILYDFDERWRLDPSVTFKLEVYFTD